MASDLEQLIDMGFDKERVELAISKTGGRKSSSIENIRYNLANTSDSAWRSRMARDKSGQITGGD